MAWLINNIFALDIGCVTVNTSNGYWVPRAGEMVVLDESCGNVRVWQMPDDKVIEDMEVVYRWPKTEEFTKMAQLAIRHWRKKAWWR